MEWIADPERAGGWLRERLDENLGVVPHGFPAYARVFHPAQVRALPDRPVPEMEEWVRMPDAEQQRLMALFDDRPATWAETAAAFGTVMHPLAQWSRLVRTPEGGDWQVRNAPDGREFTSPDEGSMAADLFARLAAHLVAHTTTPDAGVAALWEGHGGLLGFHGPTPSRTFLSFSDDPQHQAMLNESIHDRFNNPFAKPVWQPGILSDEISHGPRLRLPGRDHVLFSAAPSAFADPDWVLGAPWRDRPAEERGFAPAAQHPSILWPADRAWVMVSEIDFDSTIVAGSGALVAEICADPHLEAHTVADGADLSWDGDEVNG
ncbi:hypothetical protein [Microbacterium sp. CIAB417]|uniref:hypothetical protein n=1 Tax=Microbacterium sp. CIAB417 TaxID=2860287 RepID=UPI001FAC3EB9|nr:hypothetical protein [Microbacterium sp. CIAB417]